MRLRLLIALVLLLTAPGGGRVAGSREPSLCAFSAAPSPIERLEAWTTAIEAHTPGQLDEPASLIAAWPRAVLDEIFRYQKAFLVVVNGPDGVELARLRQAFGETDLERMFRLARTSGLYQDRPRFIKHAALLHTDIAILAPHSGDTVVPFVATRPAGAARSLRLRACRGGSPG